MTTPIPATLIPGDGIGKEVMPEGLRVLEAVAKKHRVPVKRRPPRGSAAPCNVNGGDEGP